MPMLQTVLAALVGAFVFERLRVPAGALIGAMVAVAALNLTDRASASIPAPIGFLAFAALGWAIGQGVTRESVGPVLRSIAPLAVVVVGMLAFGGLVAAVLVRAGWMDGITAFLAASPGALPQMTALADSLGANAPMVVAAHTIRVVTVVVVSPILARVVAGSG